jgi:two-component system, NarL family, sensor histidine kinase UhpB
VSRPTAAARSGVAARLLGIGLSAKLLIANGSIVALWGAATWQLARDAASATTAAQYELLLAVLAIGTVLGVGANALVLRSALAPLRELERVARAVEAGDQVARAVPGLVHDPQTDRVVAVLNAMLDGLAAQRRQLAQLSGREMAALETERQLVARELLGEVGQSCAAVQVGLQAVVNRLGRERAEVAAARAQAAGLIELVRGVNDAVRSRAQGLRPAALDDLGLVPALRSATQRWSETHGLRVALDAAAAGPRLPAPLEVALYRVAEEAVANAGRHAGASRVDVRLHREGDGVELRIVDDGRGFDTAHLAAPALGLASMRERVALVGGELVVASRPGAGASVVARVPLTAATLKERDGQAGIAGDTEPVRVPG